MPIILWASFSVSIMYTGVGDDKPANIFTTILWEQGNRSMYPPQTLRAGWICGSLSLSCFPSSLGKRFTLWFPTRHLVSTEWDKEDQGFSVLSWTAPSIGCDGGFGQVLWVGRRPGSSHWLSGMSCSITSFGVFHMKGRHDITKVGDAVTEFKKWFMVKESDCGKSSLNQSTDLCYEIPSSPSAFSGILDCFPHGPGYWDWPMHSKTRNSGLRI